MTRENPYNREQLAEIQQSETKIIIGAQKALAHPFDHEPTITSGGFPFKSKPALTQFQRLELMTSSAIAHSMLHNYGLKDGMPHTDSETASHLQQIGLGKSSPATIRTMRRVGIQTLLLRYPVLINDTSFLVKNRNAISVEDIDKLDNQGEKVLSRAASNLGYLGDVIMFWSVDHDRKFYSQFKSAFGIKEANFAANYFRLFPFTNNPNNNVVVERVGVDHDSGLSRRQKESCLTRARIIAEHLAGLEFGTHPWTLMGGMQVAGYKRIGETAISQYQQAK